MSVEPDLRGLSESANSEQVKFFVAACAERMAQLFTGLVGSDVSRSRDMELVIRCLDLLWLPEPEVSWAEIAEKIKLFPEFYGAEEPPGLLAYAYDALAALYYAAKYRGGGELGDAISCSNHALNSAEYVSDQLNDGVDRYLIELRFQRDDIALLRDVGDRCLQLMRERAQEVSRSRLAELTAL